MLHMDIWGPYSVSSIHKHRYFLTIVDDHSRYTWVSSLKGKFQVQALVQQFISFIERQYKAIVKTIRTDNGPEFALHTFYNEKGIVLQTSCVETPQQNARVERKHQFILNIARELMRQSSLPKYLWNYAVQHAVFLINQVPSKVLGGKSPYQVLHGFLPDITMIKVFGSLCFASTLTNHRSKLDDRAKKCAFLGYKAGIKGYVAYDLHSKEILISRNMVFYEHVFPCFSQHNTVTRAPWQYLTTSTEAPATSNFNLGTGATYDSSEIPTSVDSSPASPSSIIPDTSTNVDSPASFTPNTTSAHTDTPPEPESSSPPQSEEPVPIAIDTTPAVRKSDRTRKAPGCLKQYHCMHLTKGSHTPKVVNSKCLYPLNSYISYDSLSPQHKSYAFSISSMIEPTSYKEAAKESCWIDAMNTELKALDANKTWTIVYQPSGVNPIGSKWVYKIKRKSDGTVERY